MKFARIILAWGLLSILPIPTASAYDALSPDPGSYRQGSSPPYEYQRGSLSDRDRYDRDAGGSSYAGGGYSGGDGGDWGAGRSDYGRYNAVGGQPSDGYSSDWYSSDWYSDQVDGGWRGREPSGFASEPVTGQASRSDASDPGYGWRDYARPEAPVQAQPRYGRRSYDAQDDWYDGFERSDRGDWTTPVQRPRYRFRDDPSLERQRRAGDAGGYRFRPLTDKEIERRRDSADVGPFPRSRREQRRDSGSRGGEAFGYEPEPMPGSFYDRYYRSGP